LLRSYAVVRKSIDSRILKFLWFFAEDSLALEALVDSLALKMRIRIWWDDIIVTEPTKL
jgi:hypothetical protein